MGVFGVVSAFGDVFPLAVPQNKVYTRDEHIKNRLSNRRSEFADYLMQLIMRDFDFLVF